MVKIIKLEVERMNNTALRAEVQSAENTHMVFLNGEHEKIQNFVAITVIRE